MPRRRLTEHGPGARLPRVGTRLLRPRTLLVLALAIAGIVVVSGGVSDGALPTESLPAFGVTAGSGSLSTVAELGDVNGDGIGDYAIGMPSADVAGSADAGIVYVFLGKPGALPGTPTSLDPAAASFEISGHAGEMLGYSVAGDDVNGDHINDIAIGAPMAGAPSKSGGGAVYVVFGSAHPASLSTTALSQAGYTNATTSPATPSPLGSRYDGFVVDAHTGMSLAALPDVNGDGYNDLAVGAPDAALHRPGGGGVAVLYGKPQGVHITLNDLWENGYPYFFHVDLPDLDNQHAGMSIASVGDMTGDGQPDIAIGAPQADPDGRIDAGSVWIISAHLPAVTGCLQATGLDATCPWIKLDNLTAGQGYRIDGAAAGDRLGSSLAGIGDQNGDGIRDLAIGEPGASPSGRAGAGAVVVVPGQPKNDQVTRDLAISAPLQTIVGAEAGAALGSSLAAAGDVDGDGRIDMLAGAPGESASAGAAYLVRGAPGTTSDLAQASAKIAPAGAGSMTGSAVAAGAAIDGSGADALVAAPGSGAAGAWFAIGGTGTAVLPPPPGTPVTPPVTPPVIPPVTPPVTPPLTTPTTGTGSTPAAATPAAATPATTATPAVSPAATPATPKAAAKPVVKKAKKLPLCPLKKPKPKYRLVKGKRVKVKPAPCRARPKTTAKLKATASQVGSLDSIRSEPHTA
jgi:hypothetical protein